MKKKACSWIWNQHVNLCTLYTFLVDASHRLLPIVFLHFGSALFFLHFLKFSSFSSFVICTCTWKIYVAYVSFMLKQRRSAKPCCPCICVCLDFIFVVRVWCDCDARRCVLFELLHLINALDIFQWLYFLLQIGLLSAAMVCTPFCSKAKQQQDSMSMVRAAFLHNSREKWFWNFISICPWKCST